MSNKIISRQKRAAKTRAKIRVQEKNRLTVYKSSKHIYAQILTPSNKVLAIASTVEASAKKELNSNGSNIKAAQWVGKTLAERAKSASVDAVAFDRSGYVYHGRVKALADAARSNGLAF